MTLAELLAQLDATVAELRLAARPLSATIDALEAQRTEAAGPHAYVSAVWLELPAKVPVQLSLREQWRIEDRVL